MHTNFLKHVFIVTRRVKENYQNFKLSLGENYGSLFFFLTFSLFKKCDKINGLKYLTHVRSCYLTQGAQPSAL